MSDSVRELIEAAHELVECVICGSRTHVKEQAIARVQEARYAALAALEAAEASKPEVAQAGWQPIETAPKDGTWVILGFIPDEHGFTMPPCEGFFNRKLAIPEWVWMAAPKAPLYPQQPTHWMPLPEPPKETV